LNFNSNRFFEIQIRGFEPLLKQKKLKFGSRIQNPELLEISNQMIFWIEIKGFKPRRFKSKNLNPNKI
jgi:hypothetical protein